MQIQPPGHVVQRTAFVIEPAGAHRFTYAKLERETGEEVWRWPREKPAAPAPTATGQLLDVSV